MSAFSATHMRLVTGLLLGSTGLLSPAAALAQQVPAEEALPSAPDEQAPAEQTPAEQAPTEQAPTGEAATAAVDGAAPASAAAPADQMQGRVRSITVRGNERLEAETVASYVGLSAGEAYDRNRLDQALKALYATDLFADVIILGSDTGNLIVQVQENPVVNRIILEGNKRVKEDKISPEIRLAPRQIFTRAKARSDVARIVELYRRQGRFAASVEPLIVPLDQNRVDVVFEIQEGPKSKVRRINFLGNEEFSDGKLRGEIATREAKWYRLFTSNDTYDPDRSAYDQQVLRQFYLTEGYADFRVASSVAELTPDNEDFVLTYVIEEGQKYNFGEVALESEIRDIDEDRFRALIPIQDGDDYNAKLIEDTITTLQETAGLLGYAFAEVQPQFVRNRDDLTMDVTFVVREAPRVYVERVDINGNVITRDKVVRREFRLVEGDAFNTFKVKRTQSRIQSLGFFQEGVEIEQKPGSGPDKVILEVNAQEQATGELQLSAGFSSLERFLVSASIRQRNFRGLGQELRASVNYSSFSRSVDVGFTEPYLFNRNLALGFDIFRRDFNNFNFSGNDRRTTYEQITTGAQLRTGFPITEFWSASLRYNLQLDDIFLDEDQFFIDPDGDGPLDPVCSTLRAGRFLCDAIGKRTTSSLGYSVAFDNTDNRIRPSRGHRVVLSQDIAGLGGVKYLRSSIDADKYFRFGRSDFILNIGVEGGYIRGYGGDEVRINDRYFLGEPRLRGFDIRGVGPRVVRTFYVPGSSDGPGAVNIGDTDFDGEDNFVVVGQDNRSRQDDAIGGQAYYLARAELQLPLGEGVAELGIRPSIFVDAGALFDVDFDPVNDITPIFTESRTFERIVDDEVVESYTIDVPVFREEFFGDSAKPRLSVGIGASWNSPFGPFRFDIAKALLKEPGDDTQLFQFNVGTTF